VPRPDLARRQLSFIYQFQPTHNLMTMTGAVDEHRLAPYVPFAP
jgi:hypothetical protein